MTDKNYSITQTIVGNQILTIRGLQSQIVIPKEDKQGLRKLPFGFTEQGINTQSEVEKIKVF